MTRKLCKECGLDAAEYEGLCFTCEMVDGADILEEIAEYLDNEDVA